MKTILIIYAGLDPDGSTATLAQWILRGVKSVGVTGTVMEASTVTIDDVSNTDGIICGSGDYNGNPEPAMIDFFDNVLKAGYASKLINMQTMPFGVFATSAGYGTGVQEVMQSMARSLLTFGGIYIGGGNWHTSQGVAGMTCIPNGSTTCIPDSGKTWGWVDKTGFQSHLENNATCYGRRIALAVSFMSDSFRLAQCANKNPTCDPICDPINNPELTCCPPPKSSHTSPSKSSHTSSPKSFSSVSKPNHHHKKKSIIPIICIISLIIIMILFTLYIIQNNKVS
jgi:multimeric flavodoxin WrbA